MSADVRLSRFELDLTFNTVRGILGLRCVVVSYCVQGGLNGV
jgi:hypothetical protein